GPVQVDVDMFVLSLRDVSFMNMDYTVQVYLRTRWKDSRLRYDNQPGKVKYLNLNDPSKVWRPDLFIPNEKEANFHKLLLPNTFLRIYPQGNVFYSV
ncbi:glutamate-gated chloride channel, putative, partial [Ixodes scapularis]